jgi:hypothetical protein
MIRLSGARCLAMSVVGALFGLTRFFDAVWRRIQPAAAEGRSP